MKKLFLLFLTLVSIHSLVFAGYDPYNGRRTTYETDYYGNTYLARECTLKNGVLTSDYKAYFAKGKLEFVIRPKNKQWQVETYDYDGNKTAQVTIPAMNFQNIDDQREYVLFGQGSCHLEEYSIEVDGLPEGAEQEAWTKLLDIKSSRIPVVIYSNGIVDDCIKLDVRIDEFSITGFDSKHVTYYSNGGSGDQLIEMEYTLKSDGTLSEYKAYYNNHLDFILTENGSTWMYQEYDPQNDPTYKLALTLPKGASFSRRGTIHCNGVGTYPYVETETYAYDADGEVVEDVAEEEMNDSVVWDTKVVETVSEVQTLYTVVGQMPVDINIGTDEQDNPVITVDIFPRDVSYLMGQKMERYVDGKLDRVTELTYSNDLAYFSQFDAEHRLLQKGTYNLRYNTLVGEYLGYSYWWGSGELASEEKRNFMRVASIEEGYPYSTVALNDLELKGIQDGDAEVVEYSTDGVKTVSHYVYSRAISVGRHTKKSYYNGKEQLDEVRSYDDKGERDGLWQMIIDGDSLGFCTYRNGKMEGRARIYHDGGMEYRKPYHICTDTTQLTLVYEGLYVDDKATGVERQYYPCYYTDEQGRQRGKHVGELYVEIDHEKGLYSQYSWFDEEFDDNTYTKGLRELHFDTRTNRLNGPATLYDAAGKIIQQEMYTDSELEGWSTYRNVAFCDELRVKYTEGAWQQMEYTNTEKERTLITRKDDSHLTVERYGADGKKKELRHYECIDFRLDQLNNGARESGWFDPLGSDEIHTSTGEYEIYDAQGRVVEEGRANEVKHYDYNQKVAYVISDKDAANPVKYYVLGTEYLYSGTYREDLGNNMEAVHTIKKGLRHGTTKIMDRGSNKTIQKIKYVDGKVKD